MKEIEIKILEIDESMIRQKLDTFAEKKGDKILLITVTYSNPYNDALIRIRLINEKTLFTVKVPVRDAAFKVREEYETLVNDHTILEKQLRALGFQPVMLQEKMRTTYTYMDAEIVIDQYPQIPAYLEIEGPKEQILQIIEKLGYITVPLLMVVFVPMATFTAINASFLITTFPFITFLSL